MPEPAVSSTAETIRWGIELSALAVEVLAVVIVLVAIVYGTATFLFRLRQPVRGAYERYRVHLGRALQLGLELLVAADIVRTVALEPTLANVAVLGLLVIVRTVLSWSLVVEIEGRWPWQAAQRLRGGEAGD